MSCLLESVTNCCVLVFVCAEELCGIHGPLSSPHTIETRSVFAKKDAANAHLSRQRSTQKSLSLEVMNDLFSFIYLNDHYMDYIRAYWRALDSVGGKEIESCRVQCSGVEWSTSGR